MMVRQYNTINIMLKNAEIPIFADMWFIYFRVPMANIRISIDNK
jgi:hypothetical protein